MHADMTVVTIQSNKIVWNEDNQALLEPLYGKNIMDFLANSMLLVVVVISQSKLYLFFVRLAKNIFFFGVLKNFSLYVP